MVWMRGVEKGQSRRYLEKVQRLALLFTTGAMRSAPTAALESMLALPPIHLYLQGVATKTMTRLSRTGRWLGCSGKGNAALPTHVKICEGYSREVPETVLPCDYQREFLPTGRKFTVEIRSREEWKRTGSPKTQPYSLSCFTDGSRMGESSGAAVFFPHPGYQDVVYPLGEYPTVFQAEVMALIQATNNLLEAEHEGTDVNIYVDSQSTLRALESEEPVSGLVQECFHALQGLARRTRVRLIWIPAHSGYSGNERVDELAKLATETSPVGPEPHIPIAKQTITSAIDGWVRKAHADEWRRSTACRQAKQFVSIPNRGMRRYCLNRSRETLRLLTMIVTGHSCLNAHLFRMGVAHTPICPKCGRGEESRNHFIGECEGYSRLRLEILGWPTMPPQEFKNIPLSDLVRFIYRSGRLHREESGTEVRKSKAVLGESAMGPLEASAAELRYSVVVALAP